jgi:hypothetical protein
MRKLISCIAVLAAATVGSAAGQAAPEQFSVEPFIGYGFFGELPDGIELESGVTYGGRLAYGFSRQWSAFLSYQRSNPSDVTIDHWSSGLELSYIPRGGAEGMIPILLEAGVGQARYPGFWDLAANLGIGSALQFTPNLAIRLRANDYLSDYGDFGVEQQFFVSLGGEYTF